MTTGNTHAFILKDDSGQKGKKKNAESFFQPRRSCVQPRRIQLSREADQIVDVVQLRFSASGGS